jgi:hypothetical protein
MDEEESAMHLMSNSSGQKGVPPGKVLEEVEGDASEQQSVYTFFDIMGALKLFNTICGSDWISKGYVYSDF